MDRPALPSTVWLAGLIKASEVVGASAAPCDPAAVKAFSHRLEMPADTRPVFEVDKPASGYFPRTVDCQRAADNVCLPIVTSLRQA